MPYDAQGNWYADFTDAVDPNAPPQQTYDARTWLNSRSTTLPNAMPTFKTVQDFIDFYSNPTVMQSPDAKANQAFINQVKANPSGYEINNGMVMTGPNWLERYAPYLAAGALTAGAVLPALGVGAGADAAATAAATDAGAASVPIVGGATIPELAGTAAATGGSGGAALLSATGLSKILPAALQYGLPVAGNLIGATLQSNASKDAAQLNYQATEDALKQAQAELDYQHSQDAIKNQRFNDVTAYNQGQYGNYVARLAPYQQAGADATSRLTAILGGTPSTAPMPVGSGQIPAAAANSTQMVQLRAPNGQVQAVPAAQASHYLALGATQV